MSEEKRVFCSMCGKRRYERFTRSLEHGETGDGQKVFCFVIGKRGDDENLSCFEKYVISREERLKIMWEGMVGLREQIVNIDVKKSNWNKSV